MRAERGGVVITRGMAEQIAARYALDPRVCSSGGTGLPAHELQFHLGAHTGASYATAPESLRASPNRSTT